MNKINKLPLTFISFLMILVGCSEDVVFDENTDQPEPSSDKSVVVTVSIPSTRIALNQQADNSISLSWESGDKLQLLFVQGDVKVPQSDVSIINIQNEGKSATFEVSVPGGIDSESTFDLYGVYGGGGLSTDDPALAVLPVNAGDANSLNSVQEREDAMLYFSSNGIDLSNPNINVTFEHIGSLFSISLKNSATVALSDIDEVRLTSRSGGWAFNSGAGGSLFNLQTGEFENSETAGNYLSFTAPKSTIDSGETIELWGWYPPLDNIEWPNISLRLLDGDGNIVAESNNFREGGRAPVSAKSYYFNAEWDGKSLLFANSSFETLSGFKSVEKRFTIDQTTLPEPFNVAGQLVSMAVSGEQLILKSGYNSTLQRGAMFSYNAHTGAYESTLDTHHGINRLSSDSQGRLIGPNLGNVGGAMSLFKLENVNASREDFYSAPYNGETGTQWGHGGGVGVYGDISKDAVIFVPVSRPGKMPITYRFVIENGVLSSSSPEFIEYGEYTDPTRYNPFGNIGFGIPAGPKVEDGYIFGDREEFAYFVDGVKHTFKDEDTGTWTYGGTIGGKVFDMNGKKYFAVFRTISTNSGMFNILDITNPAAIRMTEQEREDAGINFVVHESDRFDTVLGENSGYLGNIDVKYLDNGNVMLYFMHGNSGVEAYELIANN